MFIYAVIFFTEAPDFEGGLILRRGCTVEHVVSSVHVHLMSRLVLLSTAERKPNSSN